MKNIFINVKIKILIFLLSLSSLYGQSFFENDQSPRFGLIDRAMGLTSLSISSVQQDKYGYIWFGSQGGLNRYDGKDLVVYNHDPFDSNTILNDLVQTLYYEEESNYIWVGTYGGLSGLDIDTGKYTHYQKKEEGGLSNNIVTAIVRGSSGDLWVGTMDGLNRISRESGEITLIETAHITVRSLLLDSSDRLWIGTYGGLQYWNEKTQTLVTPDLDLPSLNVMSLKETAPGKILIGMWGGGIMEYWPDKGHIKTYEVPDDRIYTVLESSDGTLWAGSWGGGLWAQPVGGEAVWFKDAETSELSNAIIYNLFEDRGGLVWVGTNGGGLHYLSPRRINYRIAAYDASSESISNGKIDVIHIDKEGDLYLGIYSGGLNLIDSVTGKITKYTHDADDPDSLGNDTINAIIEDSQGIMWIAHIEGLDSFDKKTGEFKRWGEDIHPDHPLSNIIVSHVFEDSRGKLWIGTYGSGIDVYDRTDNSLVNYRYDSENPDSLSDDIIYNIMEMKDGSIWIATNNGLNKFNDEDNTFTSYYYDPNDSTTLSGNNTRSLTEDSQGRLWIGTYSSGLNYYDSQKDIFYHYTTRDGLSSNNVLSVMEGDDQRIWISTRGGINIIDPATNKVDILDEKGGLFGVFFNYGHYKDDQGALYFGGSHGVTKIDSHREIKNQHKPDIHISELSIMGKPQKYDHLVLDNGIFHLLPGENFLSLTFIALDYESPEHNQYAYMMEGFDKDWIYSGNRNFASYTNLPPGKYQFKVMASNNDLLWNEEDLSISLIVAAPWYKKWWAYFLYILIPFSFFILLFRLRETSLLEKQNRELEYANNLLERVNSELEILSIHDNLTGLYNRHYFDKHLGDEFLRALRANSPLAVLMIDIDRFKKFNDTYGHQAGDRALELIAGALKRAVARNTDFITRYGGEEFTIVLFHTPREGALMVAQNIQEEIKTTLIPVEKKELVLTLSIGIHAAIPKDLSEQVSFIKKADDALYLAKKNGRNRTEVWED